MFTKAMKIKNSYLFWFVLFATTAFGQKDTIVTISEFSIDTMGKIKFAISYFGTGTSGSLEQYKNGKWTNIQGLGSSRWVIVNRKTEEPLQKKIPTRKIEKDSCTVKFHKGVNTYRIKITRPYRAISNEIKLTSKVSNDDGSVWVSGNKIFRDDVEYYEIMNNNGDLVLKGEDKTIDISSLSPGSYFFYTKKSTTPFTK
jgi:hypothetical protein